MMDDLQTLIAKLKLSFIVRSVARELTETLLCSKTGGELPIKVAEWVTEWGISETDIWSAIDRLEAEGFWQIKQGIEHSVLYCPLIASSSKAVQKKKAKSRLSKVKELSAVDRANALDLSKVGPSAVSEISSRIPKELRKEALAGGYPGWLPAANFGISGIVFSPDQGLKNQVLKEFPGICIESTLSLMFEDLKYSKDRPTVQTYSFWIRRWVLANADRVTAVKTGEEISSLAAQKLDEY